MTQLRAFERDEGLSPSAGGPSPRSPAATEAADETEALHRMLAGNDPVSSLRAQFSPPEETTEASGGIDLDTIHAKAATGVDYVSVGRLTQSAPAADIGLDFTPL